MLLYTFRRLGLAVLIVCLAMLLLLAAIHMVPGDPAGIALGPRATPEMREAFKVKMGLDQLEDMQSMPGSPLSMVSTFMELPENKQALDLLTDMVSRDTFIYGETSCIQFTKLLMALQRANQMASLSQAVDDELDD